MGTFIHEHQLGIINGVAWVLALGAHYWLGVTDKVAAASFVELIINGILALKKKPMVVPPTTEEKKGD